MGSNILWYYLIAVNVFASVMFAQDKRRALAGNWRIQNAVLLGTCAIGGALGGWIAMYMFHHKTKKTAYVIGVPVMVMLQAVLIFWLIMK